MYNKRTPNMLQKIRSSFETFSIVSIDLQWLKFLKVTFPTIKFIKSAAEGFPLKHFWTLDASRTVSHEITLLCCKDRFTVVRIPEKYQKQSKVITSLKSYIFHCQVYQRSLSFAGTLQGICQWILEGLVLKLSLSRT